MNGDSTNPVVPNEPAKAATEQVAPEPKKTAPRRPSAEPPYQRRIRGLIQERKQAEVEAARLKSRIADLEQQLAEMQKKLGAVDRKAIEQALIQRLRTSAINEAWRD